MTAFAVLQKSRTLSDQERTNGGARAELLRRN